MKIGIELRLENNEVGNTWFSGTLDNQPDVQLHMPNELYNGLGKPPKLMVTIDTEPLWSR
jgi:hypothetical protein